MNGSNEPRFPLVGLIAGFTIWAVAFVVIYAIFSVGCRFGWQSISIAGPVSLQQVVLALLFIIAVIAAVAVIVIFRRRSARSHTRPRIFLERVGLVAGWAALVSTIVTFGPIFFLSSCI